MAGSASASVAAVPGPAAGGIARVVVKDTVMQAQSETPTPTPIQIQSRAERAAALQRRRTDVDRLVDYGRQS